MTTRLVLSACAAFASAVSFGDTLIPLDETGLVRMRSGFGSAKAGKSVDGNALRVGGVEYRRGVGTHAPSTHRIAANGNALSFSALVGVDDECGGKGSVVFRVIADGKVVAEVAAKGGEAAKQISADLAGTKRIVLEVTDGGDGMHYDHADWCDAVFSFKDGTKPLSAAEMTRQLGILTPKASPSPRINAPARYGVRPGRPILFKLPVTGLEPIEVSAKGLPGGLSFDPATRILSGSIAKPGEYPVVFSAQNTVAGRVEFKTVTFVVGDKIALTPPMGWNSWNAFAGGVSDAKMRTAVDKIVELGLDAHGYSYVNIDDFWQKNPQNGKSDPTLAGPERNADGTIAPNARFPDMKALADYIHSKGLKAGLYSSPGPYTCGGCTGSWLHELQDAKSYAAWGYDYLKYDWCSYTGVQSGEGHDKYRRPYFLMGRFLAMQPRDIVFSLCQYGWDEVSTWGALAGGNCWRTTGDIFDTWPSVYGGIRAQAALWQYSAPGAWNDADMLVLGRNVWAGKGGGRAVHAHVDVVHVRLAAHDRLRPDDDRRIHAVASYERRGARDRPGSARRWRGARSGKCRRGNRIVGASARGRIDRVRDAERRRGGEGLFDSVREARHARQVEGARPLAAARRRDIRRIVFRLGPRPCNAPREAFPCRRRGA